MNSRLCIRLVVTPEQDAQLAALQRSFVAACNTLAEMARDAGVTSRVGLHHLGYHALRQRYPALGSQLACNVVYSVSRAYRLLFQHPASPLRRIGRGRGPMPRLQFADDAPVFFDRHTLSIRAGHASMYSLDGRLRFDLPLAPEDERRLCETRLREIALSRDERGLVLRFDFGNDAGAGSPLAIEPHTPHDLAAPVATAAGRPGASPACFSVTAEGMTQAGRPVRRPASAAPHARPA